MAACDGRDAAPGVLEDVVAFGQTVQLQESDEVINVTPQVTLDPRGGFLVSDEREGQVRSYAPDGRLRWHLGRLGSGPGEFRALSRSVRLAGGQVLAAELSGSFTLLDPTGSTALATIRNPFFHVQDMDVVDDSTVLVSARLEGRQGNGPSLHLWDVRTHRVRSSFFDPFAAAPNPVAATLAGWTRTAIRGDTVAAVFALSDTLYLFTLDGRPAGQRPIAFQRFRPVPAETPSGGSDPVRRARWLGSFDFVSDIFWLPDGRMLVPYHSILPDQALTRAHHLFGMDRAGNRLFEIPNVPRLLTVEPASGTLVFVAPDAEAPNRWTLAHLR